MNLRKKAPAPPGPPGRWVRMNEWEEPYRILNAHGKTFIERYLPAGVSVEEVSRLKAFHWPVSCRDAALHLDRAIKGEVLAGRATAHDCVLLDLSRAERRFLPELFEEHAVVCRGATGEDLSLDGPVQVRTSGD